MAGAWPCRSRPDAAQMVPKCGSLKEWHWAHKAGSDCDPWSEPIGPWHLSWQTALRPEHVEVPRQPHRADMMGNGGVVVELQHSSISPEEIQQRESFYGDMVRLFDATFRFRVVRSDDMAFFASAAPSTLQLAACPSFSTSGTFSSRWSGSPTASRIVLAWVTLVTGIGLWPSTWWTACGEGARVIPIPSDDEPKANPWENRCPYSSDANIPPGGSTRQPVNSGWCRPARSACP